MWPPGPRKAQDTRAHGRGSPAPSRQLPGQTGSPRGRRGHAAQTVPQRRADGRGGAEGRGFRAVSGPPSAAGARGASPASEVLLELGVTGTGRARAGHVEVRSRAHSVAHLLVHLLAHPLAQSLSHSLTLSFIHLLARSLTHPLAHLQTHLLYPSLIHSLAHSSTRLLTHSLAHLLAHSLTHICSPLS